MKSETVRALNPLRHYRVWRVMLGRWGFAVIRGPINE